MKDSGEKKSKTSPTPYSMLSFNWQWFNMSSILPVLPPPCLPQSTQNGEAVKRNIVQCYCIYLIIFGNVSWDVQKFLLK